MKIYLLSAHHGEYSDAYEEFLGAFSSPEKRMAAIQELLKEEKYLNKILREDGEDPSFESAYVLDGECDYYSQGKLSLFEVELDKLDRN